MKNIKKNLTHVLGGSCHGTSYHIEIGSPMKHTWKATLSLAHDDTLSPSMMATNGSKFTPNYSLRCVAYMKVLPGSFSMHSKLQFPRGIKMFLT